MGEEKGEEMYIISAEGGVAQRALLYPSLPLVNSRGLEGK